MKKRELAGIARSVASRIPSLYPHRQQLLIAKPFGSILRAICLDHTVVDATSYYVQVFVQPLYVPADHEVLNIGWRLGGGCHRWRAADNVMELVNAIEREAMPYLLRAATLEGFLEVTSPLVGNNSSFTQEAIAYTLVRVGQRERALSLLASLRSTMEVATVWDRRTCERIDAVSAALRHDPRRAVEILQEWEITSKERLGLDSL